MFKRSVTNKGSDQDGRAEVSGGAYISKQASWKTSLFNRNDPDPNIDYRERTTCKHSIKTKTESLCSSLEKSKRRPNQAPRSELNIPRRITKTHSSNWSGFSAARTSINYTTLTGLSSPAKVLDFETLAKRSAKEKLHIIRELYSDARGSKKLA